MATQTYPPVGHVCRMLVTLVVGCCQIVLSETSIEGMTMHTFKPGHLYLQVLDGIEGNLYWFGGDSQWYSDSFDVVYPDFDSMILVPFSFDSEIASLQPLIRL